MESPFFRAALTAGTGSLALFIPLKMFFKSSFTVFLLLICTSEASPGRATFKVRKRPVN